LISLICLFVLVMVTGYNWNGILIIPGSHTALKIEKAANIGFCFGVKRAIDILEKVARERGGVETLGAVVHNREVLQRLAGIGVRVARDVSDMRGNKGWPRSMPGL
jgi:hypothetical protein